jgi:hypothetical protein
VVPDGGAWLRVADDAAGERLWQTADEASDARAEAERARAEAESARAEAAEAKLAEVMAAMAAMKGR